DAVGVVVGVGVVADAVAVGVELLGGVGGERVGAVGGAVAVDVAVAGVADQVAVEVALRRRVVDGRAVVAAVGHAVEVGVAGGGAPGVDSTSSRAASANWRCTRRRRSSASGPAAATSIRNVRAKAGSAASVSR